MKKYLTMFSLCFAALVLVFGTYYCGWIQGETDSDIAWFKAMPPNTKVTRTITKNFWVANWESQLTFEKPKVPKE